MQSKQEPVILGHAASQRGLELLGRRFQLTLELAQSLGSRLARHDGLEDRATGLAQDVADNAGQFDVGILQDLLEPECLLGQCARQLLPCAGQLAQRLELFRGDKAAPDQSMREEFGQPLGVGHV